MAGEELWALHTESIESELPLGGGWNPLGIKLLSYEICYRDGEGCQGRFVLNGFDIDAARVGVLVLMAAKRSTLGQTDNMA